MTEKGSDRIAIECAAVDQHLLGRQAEYLVREISFPRIPSGERPEFTCRDPSQLVDILATGFVVLQQREDSTNGHFRLLNVLRQIQPIMG